MVIIGVVAAITVPVMVNKIQHVQNVAALKKVHSTLSQAYLNLQREYGRNVIRQECTTNDSSCLGNLFKKELKLIQGELWVPSQNIAEKCWPDSNITNSTNGETHYCTVSMDGMIYDFDMEHGNNMLNYSNVAYINIDINGLKGPNKYGKDRYVFSLASYKIMPFRASDRIYCTNGRDGSAFEDKTCAYEYLFNSRE